MHAALQQHEQLGSAPARTGGAGYRRHRPEDTVLYSVVEQYADAFLEGQVEQGRGLPRFVREEFEAYLRCGRLEHGFVRAKCTGCRHEHLVAFSCKRRGWCPSCASRRMAESGAHLVDNVLPKAPYRQWVLTFPWPLRMLFAAQPDWISRVLGVVIRALTTALLKRVGLRRSDGARTGMVTFIQRFGSKLNLNVHLHVLSLDGAYSFKHGKARFHRAGGLRPEELEALLTTVITRVTRTLVRAGVLVAEDEQPYLDLQLDSPYEQLAGAAIRYVIAAGPQAGRATMRLSDPLLAVEPSSTRAKKPFTAARDGFSLNCAVACDAHERGKLERLCRYMARGPIAQERLSVDGDGLVVLELKRAFSDGTTHVLFEPHDFIARLAALVPRPKAHLVRYHGVFAPNARQRPNIVARPKVAVKVSANDECESNVGVAPLGWMARLKRVFAIDLKRCPHCGGELRVIAVIAAPGVISRILQHMDLDGSEQPRAPPMPLANRCH
jgi:hypothetical protein